ncbi:hypothetical protein J5I95_10770 [Candidatus Poribacteria bacterium]|nr:hypothetical protein [Candidatus Poribacteria bacterium]
MLSIKDFSLTRIVISISILILVSGSVSFSGEILDDFEDGDTVGWERSPQNQDSEAFWGIKEGETFVTFDPEGLAWNVAISQFNFTGEGLNVGDPSKWTDYDVEVDLRHTAVANFPGGIRGRVNLETGSHYVVWLYPGSSKMNLFSNPGWDINTGLVNHGEAAYKPEVDKWHKVKLSFQGTTIKVFYDGKEMIDVKNNLYKSGTVALGNQDKVVHYDNVRITGPGIPDLNASPVKPEDKLTTTWGQIKSSH